MFFIILNMLVMATHHADEHAWHQSALYWSNIVFTVIYGVEMVIKMVGYGIKDYFYFGWNQFDFLIVMASIGGIIGESAGMEGNIATVITMFRVVRVSRIFK